MNNATQQQLTSYITTSLPYVNAKPHLGHAFEFVLTDAIARYHKLCERKVRLLSGTDDNSLKNARAAEALGRSTAELVNEHAAEFIELCRALDVAADDYIHTSRDERHQSGVHELWRRCERSGDIYKQAYSGLFCVGCEKFLDAEELSEGRCLVHEIPAEAVEEENYFFRLSRYEKVLLELIDSERLNILPSERKREIRAFIAGGLKDFSISRSRARARGWGIAVPGDPSQIVYVWFDALAGYITALGYAKHSEDFSEFWQNAQIEHSIGKDIVRFHAVYWPAILLSAGLSLPSRILVHGFLTAAGKKLSKTSGILIEPFSLVERFGSETLRYYLLRHLHTSKDSDVDFSRLAACYDVELADQLGNLLNRTLTLIERHQQSLISEPDQPDPEDLELCDVAARTVSEFAEAFETFALSRAVQITWQLVSATNRYLDRQAPWSLAKQLSSAHKAFATRRLSTVLYHAAESLRIIAILCSPILPRTSQQIFEQLGVDAKTQNLASARNFGALSAGTQISRRHVLFPKSRNVNVSFVSSQTS